MIEHLMIITDAGLPIFFRSYSNIEINHILISGFLSAVDEFAKAGMNSALKQIQLENRYITIKRKRLQQGEEVSFILVHQHCLGFRRQEDCVCVPSSLEEISSEFLNNFIDTNYVEFELDENKRATFAALAEFEDFIDSVIKKHFLAHSIESEFPLDSEFPDIKEISDQKFLGSISFLDDQLFKFYLDSSFSNPQFHKLIKLAGIWSEFLGKSTDASNPPILELKGFKLAFSLKMVKPEQKFTIFTLWTFDTSNDRISRLHHHLSNILISESLIRPTSIEK